MMQAQTYVSSPQKCGPPTARVFEVHDSMNELRVELERLDKAIACLEEKLTPVIQPDTPRACGTDAATRPARVPLAEQILGTATMARFSVERLERMHERLEV